MNRKSTLKTYDKFKQHVLFVRSCAPCNLAKQIGHNTNTKVNQPVERLSDLKIGTFSG